MIFHPGGHWCVNLTFICAMHPDDEHLFWKNHGDDFTIASVFTGFPRDFVLHHLDSGVEFHVDTEPFDILLMTKKFQWEWLHSVKSETGECGQRLSFTFRQIVHHKNEYFCN